MKYLLTLLFCVTLLFSKRCADQYDPANFIDAPRRLSEIIDKNLKKTVLFGDSNFYKKEGFKKITMDGNIYFIKKDAIKKEKDYLYPVKSGIWRYSINSKNRVDEIDIADAYEYKDGIESIANEINSDFEGLWNRWDGNAYITKLLPEDAQIRYKNYYLALTVYIYGVENDATDLNNSVVDYHILNYTDEVNKYIKCKESK